MRENELEQGATYGEKGKATYFNVHGNLFCCELSGVRVDDVVDEIVGYKVDHTQHYFMSFEFGCSYHLRVIIKNEKEKERDK